MKKPAAPKPGFPYKREKSIGILGGGQLARMLAMAAGRLGFYTVILDPNQHCPASQFANLQIVAGFDDPHALAELAGLCATVTYEFENVPAKSIQTLERSCKTSPGSKALEISQDRLVEKRFIQKCGMKTTAFLPVSDKTQLEVAVETIGLPAILKTRRLGYDGKGQMRLTPENIGDSNIEKLLSVDCILEAQIDFDCEISIIGARKPDGQTTCYDPARNSHDNGILSHSVVPCGLPDEIIENARSQTVELMNRLDYVGVIGVEFFVTASGELLINEFAPRVHNSGHWTEAACLISQFEQHIRAITDLPLGSTARHADCRMQNLIGDKINEVAEIATTPNVLIHHYGKSEIRDGRKMGHITTLLPKK